MALDPFHEVRFLSRIRRIEKVDFGSTIIRRDVSGHLPYRQSDRVCSFVLVLFLGAFDIRGSGAGERQLKTAVWGARGL